MVTNKAFCYEEKLQKEKDVEDKQYILQHLENHKNNNEPYTDGLRVKERK